MAEKPAFAWRITLKRRIVVAVAALVVWSAAIEARLVYLQVGRHADLMARAERQQLRTVETAGCRQVTKGLCRCGNRHAMAFLPLMLGEHAHMKQHTGGHGTDRVVWHGEFSLRARSRADSPEPRRRSVRDDTAIRDDPFPPRRGRVEI